MLQQNAPSSLLNVINQLPAMLYSTDTKGNFIYVNQFTKNSFGFRKSIAIEGLSYRHMRCKAVEQAENFLLQTNTVIEQERSLKFIAHCCYADHNWKFLFGEKSPIFDKEKKVVGCAAHFLEINNCNIANLSWLLCKADASRAISKKNQQISYKIEDTYIDFKLNKRESECLFFLLRGKTSKEIAYILKISPKTVAGYIDQVKTKMDCYSKSSLIEKAIYFGLMGMVPQSILSNNLLNGIS